MNAYLNLTADRESEAQTESKRTPANILVVDDEIVIRQLNTLVLLRRGFEVHTAEDGSDAWNALTAGQYDLVITDNEMPNLTGVQLFFKMQMAGMELPVIFASGTVPKGRVVEAGSFQPAAILLKPYTIDEMLAVVERVLRETGATDTSPEWEMYPLY